MKLLRTIRLDPSDTFVFERAAEPGEWAVSGAFSFWNKDVAKFEGKIRTSFRSGILGVSSLGWSTLAQIVNAKAADREEVIETLARQLVDHFGAPDLSVARRAAEDEVAFTESLCIHPPADTLIAVRRSCENGEIRESFRTLQPRGSPRGSKVFSFIEVEGEEEPAEAVDLAGLAEKRP